MTFVRKICTFKVDEIDTYSQFHQHFTRKFLVQKCFKQLFSCFILALKFFGAKVASKMLMKLKPERELIRSTCCQTTEIQVDTVLLKNGNAIKTRVKRHYWIISMLNLSSEKSGLGVEMNQCYIVSPESWNGHQTTNNYTEENNWNVIECM